MKVKYSLLFFVVLFQVGRVSAQQQISLEQFIALALEKNYDIKLIRNQSQAAATDKEYAYGLLLPQVNATGALGWNNNNQRLEFADVTRNSSGQAKSNSTTAGVQLNWVLFDGTKMFATMNRFNAIAVQGELLVKDQMVNTVATVINNYYNIVRQKQQLMAIKEQMGVSEERVKLAERKLDVGTGAKPELLQAKVDYNTQRTQVVQQEAIILQLKEQMNASIGDQLPKEYDVTDTIAIDLNMDRDQIFSELESSNYSLQALRANKEIAQFSLKERRAERSPVISFTSAYNYNQTDNVKLINPFGTVYSKTTVYNYGFNVVVPILNNFVTHKSVQQAHIIYDRQELIYNQQRLNINVALNNAWTNYENAKKILIIEEETVLLAKENVMIALESFKRGIATSIELRTAQQSLADSYNRLIAARYNAKISTTELMRLKGALLVSQ